MNDVLLSPWILWEPLLQLGVSDPIPAGGGGPVRGAVRLLGDKVRSPGSLPGYHTHGGQGSSLLLEGVGVLAHCLPCPKAGCSRSLGHSGGPDSSSGQL